MIAEMFIGYKGRKDTVTSFEELAPRHKNLWKYAGFQSVAGLLIMTFYSVVIGWIFNYIVTSLTHLPSSVKEAESTFTTMLHSDFSTQFLFHTLAFFIVTYVVSRGIKGGIEKLNDYLMPSLIVILTGMFLYALSLDSFGKAFSFMFAPDWSKLNSEAFVTAVGHAFFTLSLGMGAIMTYAASMPKETNIVTSALWVVFLDTAIALVAGLMLFTFLYQYGSGPDKGPGLVFISLPVILNKFGFLGIIFSLLFFLALAFAGITSAISLVEPVVQYLIDRFKMTRTKAVVLSSFVYWFVGIGAILSYSKNWGKLFSFFNEPLFDLLEYSTDSILLPLGGLLIALFVGYVMPKNRVFSALEHEMGERFFKIWIFSIRYIVPVALVFMILNLTGIIKIG
jgi:NSS family neurotransmitter:Na+ symporter